MYFVYPNRSQLFFGLIDLLCLSRLRPEAICLIQLCDMRISALLYFIPCVHLLLKSVHGIVLYNLE